MYTTAIFAVAVTLHTRRCHHFAQFLKERLKLNVHVAKSAVARRRAGRVLCLQRCRRTRCQRCASIRPHHGAPLISAGRDDERRLRHDHGYPEFLPDRQGLVLLLVATRRLQRLA